MLCRLTSQMVRMVNKNKEITGQVIMKSSYQHKLLKESFVHCVENHFFKVLGKYDLLKNIPWNRIFCESKRWSSQKSALKHDIFCIIGKDDISFSYKYDITL